MSKHTPGPWRADLADIGGQVFGFSIVAEHGTHWHPVAYQSTYQHTNSECYEPAERKANARLIAAAPELLEALKLLDEAFCADDYGTKEGREKGRAALVATRAAIAKAEGKQ